MPESQAHVVILLALYNGERFLQEQLDSLEAQHHRNWSLIVSDDGSTDDSLRILTQFSDAHPHRSIRIVQGPQAGFAQNFLSLLHIVPDAADHVAFCDQDDIWLPAKLSRAVAVLSACQGPALAIGCRTFCDAAGRPIGASVRPSRGPSFGNALLQNIGPGNTMVLNRAAWRLMCVASAQAPEVSAHDWWCYQVVSGHGGRVLFDEVPTVLYRQHGQNQIGTNRALRGRLWRVQALLSGRFRAWTDAHVAALAPLHHGFSTEHRQMFAAFVRARQAPLMSRIRLFRQSGAHRQSKFENTVFWVAMLFNRI